MGVDLPEGKGTVELCDGVVVLRWIPGAVINEQDARAAMSRVSGFCDGHDRPVLVEIPELRWVDHAARTVLAGPWPVTRVAIVGPSPVDRVMVSFWQARHNPACPAKLFTSAREGLSWLRRNVNFSGTAAPSGARADTE